MQPFVLFFKWQSMAFLLLDESKFRQSVTLGHVFYSLQRIHLQELLFKKPDERCSDIICVFGTVLVLIDLRELHRFIGEML